MARNERFEFCRRFHCDHYEPIHIVSNGILCTRIRTSFHQALDVSCMYAPHRTQLSVFQHIRLTSPQASCTQISQSDYTPPTKSTYGLCQTFCLFFFICFQSSCPILAPGSVSFSSRQFIVRFPQYRQVRTRWKLLQSTFIHAVLHLLPSSEHRTPHQ